MDEDEKAVLESRIAALEGHVKALQRQIDDTQGEAIVAGQLAPAALTIITQIRPDIVPVLQLVLDRLLLRFEEGHGRFPGSQAALAVARSRLETTLRGLPVGPPAPG